MGYTINYPIACSLYIMSYKQIGFSKVKTVQMMFWYLIYSLVTKILFCRYRDEKRTEKKTGILSSPIPVFPLKLYPWADFVCGNTYRNA